MNNAIAKCGVLKRKATGMSMLRRKEARFHVLTNQGGFFCAKGFAAEWDSLKPLPALHAHSEVKLEKSGSGDAAPCVIKVYARGHKAPQLEVEAASDAETIAWYRVMLDVIELVDAVNGDEEHAGPRAIMGGRFGEPGWYLEATGRMALYTLNRENMWVVRDRREYDEPTVLNWIANERPRDSSTSGRGGGYPTVVGGAAAISGSAVDLGPSASNYPVNARGGAGVVPPVPPTVDHPSQQAGGQGAGGGGGTWAAPSPASLATGPTAPYSSSSGSGSPEGGGSIVGGVMVSRGSSVGSAAGGGGGGPGGPGRGVTFAAPPAVLPSTFEVEKGGGDGFGSGVGCLKLRRPSTCQALKNGGDGGAGGQSEEVPAVAAAAVETAASHGGRGVRGGRWRGSGAGAAAAVRRPPGSEEDRRPLEISPAMEVLLSSLAIS